MNMMKANSSTSRMITMPLVYALAITMVSCGFNKSTGKEGGGAGSSSSFYDIDSGNSGTVLTKDAALGEIQNRQATLQDKIKSIMTNGVMSYNGGYEELADGSGGYFPTTCEQMADGTQACHRSGEQQMYSANGMGQEPPSKTARLNDLVGLMYEVSRRSVSGDQSKTGYYSDIEVRTGATIKGTVAGKQVNKSQCLKVSAKDTQYRMQMEFYDCGDAFYARGLRRGNLEGVKTYWAIEKGSGQQQQQQQSQSVDDSSNY